MLIVYSSRLLRKVWTWFKQWHAVLVSKIIWPANLYISRFIPWLGANENAYKAIFIRHNTLKRNGQTLTQEDLQECIMNKGLGCPDLSILSFKGGFHGRTIGTLATTHSKSIHKQDVPSLDWPIASFPKYKYPLEDNVEYNRGEDDKCLKEVDELIDYYNNEKKRDVAGLVVEPIQSEGGDNYGSAYFFQNLQKLAKKKNVVMLIDEVQTGLGATGKLWAHEHFNLPESPDIMTFAKKMHTGGYYYKSSLNPDQPYRIMNTWVGDPIRVLYLEATLEAIRRDNLIELNRKTGKNLIWICLMVRLINSRFHSRCVYGRQFEATLQTVSSLGHERQRSRNFLVHRRCNSGHSWQAHRKIENFW